MSCESAQPLILHILFAFFIKFLNNQVLFDQKLFGGLLLLFDVGFII